MCIIVQQNSLIVDEALPDLDQKFGFFNFSLFDTHASAFRLPVRRVRGIVEYFVFQIKYRRSFRNDIKTRFFHAQFLRNTASFGTFAARLEIFGP